MNNSINNENKNLQSTINDVLGSNPQIGDDIKRLINTLTEEDVKKISALMKNRDLQAIASSIIEAKSKKGQ